MWKLFILLGLCSCSLLFKSQGSQSARGSHYHVYFSAPDWDRPKEDERSDYVWVNRKDGSILLSNSFCDEFQDRPLENLALNTFKMVSELEIEKQFHTTFHRREAYQLEGHGKVDGVSVNLIILNTRRNNCYFDFVSISPLTHLEVKNLNLNFDLFLKSVEFK